MCCFSRAVPFVGGTKIFARAAGDHQLLAYSMNVELDEELAMVLPLPVPPNGPDDAVTFIDLSGYAELFADLAAAFPPMFVAQKSRGLGGLARGATLVVHDVGDFEASFVPRVADFARLDARFRLPAGVFDALPAYADAGFAVFRLKPLRGRFGGRKRQTIHPMALAFHLAKLTEDLAPHFLNGRQLWSGTSYLDGSPHRGGGRGYVQFTPFTPRVELQQVRLGFDVLPDPEATEDTLRALEVIVDRAVA